MALTMGWWEEEGESMGSRTSLQIGFPFTGGSTLHIPGYCSIPAPSIFLSSLFVIRRRWRKKWLDLRAFKSLSSYLDEDRDRPDTKRSFVGRVAQNRYDPQRT
jgi:hypothetical protein